MPLAKLDDTSALVVIDLQKGIVGLLRVHPLGEIVGRAAWAGARFCERGLACRSGQLSRRPCCRAHRKSTTSPSLLPDWTELVAELDCQPGD